MADDDDTAAKAARPPRPEAPAGAGPRRRGGWLRRLVIGLAVAVGLYALLGFVVAPRVLQGQLTGRLSAELARPVAIGSIELNPFTLVLRVRDLSVSSPDAAIEIAGFDLLEADLSSRTLRHLAPVVSAVTLKRPRLRLARDEQGRLSVQDLLDRWAARPAGQGPTPSFSVANIAIDDGRFEFDDAKLGLRHEVAQLALRLPFVSSLPVDQAVYIEPSLKASLDGEPFELQGRSLPFRPSHESVVDLDFEAVDLTRFVGYLPAGLPVVPRSARLGAALRVVFAQAPGTAPSIAVTGGATLSELAIDEPGGAPLFAASSIAAESIALAWPANRHEIARIAITAPEVSVRRRASGRYLEPVLAALERGGRDSGPREQPAAAAAATPGGATGASWRIGEIAVSEGRLALDDDQFAPKPLRLRAGSLEASVRGLGSDPRSAADFEVAALLADGERLRASGNAVWQTGRIDAGLSVADLALPRWWWLAQPHVALDATAGVLALDARLTVTPTEGRPPAIRIDSGVARLRDLSLRQRWDKRTLLALPELDLEDVAVDVPARSVQLGAAKTSGGRLLLRREGDARFNLQRIATAADGSGAGAGAPSPASAAAGPSWTVSLTRLAIGGFAMDVEDQAAGKSANLRIEAIGLDARDLSTAKGAAPAAVELQAKVDRRGSLALSGQVGLNPVSGALRVAARNLVIVPLQPYFTEYVNALVSSGAASAEGQLSFALPEGGAARFAYSGSAAVTGFAAVTKAANEDLLRWKSLRFDRVDLDSAPMKFEVGAIALDGFYSRLIISPEGRFNLQDILVERTPQQSGAAAPTPTPTPTPAPEASPRRLRIGQVRLTDGNIDFSDFFVQPNYSANLTGMNGGISQITPDRAGDLELRGRVDDTGRVEILGKINPLARDLFLDVKANATDIDLPRLSPYSGKYVGYGIEKGKLSARVAYKVENRQLSAENNIVLDQLTFGEKIDSPSAIKLPVLFAVSLLKDRNGVIDVNLPISGSLDDPKFSVGGIVLRIIVNLIVKAVTAPFTLLASLGGAGGAELSWLAFAPGSDALDDGTRSKLEALARALDDRPGLKLDLAGRADPVADREALRKLAVERSIKAEKLKETVSGGAAAGAIDEVTIEPQEYLKYLTRAYRAADFEKPRNAIGLLKTLPPEEMEKLMLGHARVGEDDLIALANRRAQHAKDWLVDSGRIAGERLFVTAPRVDAGGAPAPAMDTSAGTAAGVATGATAAAQDVPMPATAVAPAATGSGPRVELSLK